MDSHRSAAVLTLQQKAAALAICATPLLLLLFSNDWFFTPVGYIDPWRYVGFFNFYGDPEYGSGEYKLARLPWILTGWLVNHAVPSPVAAAIVLHGTFLVAAALGMFVLGWLLFGSYEVALAGALLLGFLPAWHGSGGWDYHNTAAGAFYVWALAAVTFAAERRSALRDGLAGVAAALAIHSNITFGCFLPILALHYVAVARVREGGWPGARRILLAAAWGAGGAVAITAVLAVINVAAGREALFFRTLLEIALRYSADTGNLATWWHPWSSGWFWQSHHLALSVGVLFLSPMAWWATRTQVPGLRAIQRLVIAEFIVMAFIWSAWQFYGNLTLEWDYFHFPLIPHVLLVLVAMLSTASERVNRLWVAVAAICFLGALAGGVATALRGHEPLFIAQSPIVAPIVLFVIAGVLALTPYRWGMAGFAVVFSVANALSSPSPAVYSALAPCHISADAYRAIVGSAKFIATVQPSMSDALQWFDQDDTARTGNGCTIRLANVAYSLAGYGANYIVDEPTPMPPVERLTESDLAYTATGSNFVVIPWARSGAVDRFLDAARRSGLEVVENSSREFSVGDAQIHLTLLKMRATRVSGTPATPAG